MMAEQCTCPHCGQAVLTYRVATPDDQRRAGEFWSGVYVISTGPRHMVEHLADGQKCPSSHAPAAG